MAQPFPRVSFTMPGDGQGVPDEDIIMISVDNDTKAPILTILNAAIAAQAQSTQPAMHRA